MAKNNKKMVAVLMVVSIIAIAIIVVAAIGRFATNNSLEAGTLKGRVTIGPLCPVERIPPDPQCQPTTETYKAWPIAVYTANGKTRVASIEPSNDGSYALELPVGGYIVNLEKQYIFAKSLPQNIVIKKDEVTVLDINIDTGIR